MCAFVFMCVWTKKIVYYLLYFAIILLKSLKLFVVHASKHGWTQFLVEWLISAMMKTTTMMTETMTAAAKKWIEWNDVFHLLFHCDAILSLISRSLYRSQIIIIKRIAFCQCPLLPHRFTVLVQHGKPKRALGLFNSNEKMTKDINKKKRGNNKTYTHSPKTQ